MSVVLASVDMGPLMVLFALVIGAIVLVVGLSIWAIAVQPWKRYRAPDGTAVGGGLPRSAKVSLVVILAASVAPVVYVGITSSLHAASQRLPSARTATVVELRPGHTAAVIDTEVKLRGGGFTSNRAKFHASLRFPPSQPMADEAPRATTHMVLVGPDEPGPLSTRALDFSTSCTDCTYRFRTIVSLAEPVVEATKVVVEHKFWWEPEYAPAFADDVAKPTMEAAQVDVTTRRVTSEVVTDRLRWEPDRPTDTRLVTVDIDPGLIPPTGLASWPAIGGASVTVHYDDPRYRSKVTSPAPRVAVADASCVFETCAHYTYQVPTEASGFEVTEPVDVELRVVHWVDYFDDVDREGSIRVEVQPVAPDS